MWKFLDSVASSATKYTSIFGKFWYVLVFCFRLLIVASLGGHVYDDERGAFRCQFSADSDGCENMCFDQLVKVSHLRFWTYQLLAVITPTIFFHFYCNNVKNEYIKIKKLQEELKKQEAERNPRYLQKLTSKQKRLGPVRVKSTGKDDSEDIFVTTKLEIVYIFSLILRLALEGVFIYLGLQVFNIKDGSEVSDPGIMNYLWMRVPTMYNCKNSTTHNIALACAQHMANPETGHVNCWVSRPAEKTIFLRYMNILVVLCCVVSGIELLICSAKAIKKQIKPSGYDNDDEWIDIEELETDKSD